MMPSAIAERLVAFTCPNTASTVDGARSSWETNACMSECLAARMLLVP
jgi:hypothetical protein